MTRGCLNLVSVGPGISEQITGSALKAVADSDVIVAYELYLSWIEPLIVGKRIITTPLSQERERVQQALESARSGSGVALISSGDIGIYAMATLAFELMNEQDSFDVEVFPGVTAAVAAAALLGAPLSHDFATLNLSDLMCPWQLIEERAKHISAADLCVALYNVQSSKRREGIYRIIDILCEHKGPATLCGIVRNAFRDGQSSQIVALEELYTRSFDMFTTIVVGNRLTRRKRNWIYTPRGYDSKQGDSGAAPADLIVTDCPPGAVWLFTGTQDGNELAAILANTGLPVVVSTATEYGGQLARNSVPGATVVCGKIGRKARSELLKSKQARAIVDATHPFADKISQQLMELSKELKLTYLRYERPLTELGNYSTVKHCTNFVEAVQVAVKLGKRIFLATGAKSLGQLATLVDPDTAGSGSAAAAKDILWFARVTPDLESIEKALAAGIPQSRICAMQGPYTRSFNEALWKQWQIDCVVTKESGAAGGTNEKIEAAEALGIPIVVVGRPVLSYPEVFLNQEQLVSRLTRLCNGGE